MDERELQASIRGFEEVLKIAERLNKKGTRLAAILSTFFAFWCAFKVRIHSGLDDESEVKHAKEELTAESGALISATLPPSDVVRGFTEGLIAAAIARDRTGVSTVLASMGVLALCPMLSQQFVRMEFLARSVAGRPRVVPLTELSLFAAEVGDYARAGRYAAEAHTFAPTSCELYNLCIIEGLIAWNAGQHVDSIRFLEASISACQHDEYESLDCGVRNLNLSLVQKLLDSGHRVDVLRHLLDCRNVWQSLRPQIDVWISLIENAKVPNFQESGILRSMNEPSFRLLMQYIRASALEEGASTDTPRSPITLSRAEVIARREKLREAYRRYRDSS